VPEQARARTYSASYKLRVLAEYETMSKDGKGALLRREGLYSSLITEWRKQRDRGATSTGSSHGFHSPPVLQHRWIALAQAAVDELTHERRPGGTHKWCLTKRGAPVL